MGWWIVVEKENLGFSLSRVENFITLYTIRHWNFRIYSLKGEVKIVQGKESEGKVSKGKTRLLCKGLAHLTLVLLFKFVIET